MTLRLVVQETFPAPGRGPAGLAWDGTTLWHADYRDGRLYGLDPATAAVRLSLHCPGNLGGLAWDGRALWQALYDQEMIRGINPETNDFDDVIILEGRGWLSGVAHDGHRLWVVAQQAGQLLSVDLATNEFHPPLPAAVALGDIDFRDGYLWASAATPMRFDPIVGRFEWLADELAYAILKIDPADGRELARYQADRLYTGLCWVGDHLWLAHAGSRSLYRGHLEGT